MIFTKQGWAVLENDTHISRWVEQNGTLENEKNLIEGHIAPYVDFAGSTVIDVGAMIGDHTATYSRLVGPKGRVLAFEPNAAAYACLSYNSHMLQHPNVMPFFFALGAQRGKATMNRLHNVGASYLTQDFIADEDVVDVLTLDSAMEAVTVPPISLIKIDAEGYEPFVLQGARNTIKAHAPAIYYEVHQNALKRNGYAPQDIKHLLQTYGYTKFNIIERCSETSPQYNVLALL